MKVLLPQHAAAMAGGIGRLSGALAEALPAAVAGRHEVRLLGGETETRIASASGALQRLRFEQLTVARAARDADLVHMPDFRPLLPAATAPCLVTVHDVTFVTRPEWFRRGAAAYKSGLLRTLALRRPAAVACVSAWSRDELLGIMPSLRRSDVRVMHPGVTPGPAGVPVDADREPYLLTVSSLEPRKNHLGLLEAFRAARRAGLPHRWVVAGTDGTGGAAIRAALTGVDGVDVVGLVDGPTLERLYAGADAVVLASFQEGFGFPVLEAMARGVPVVCSTGSALDESAGEAALRVPADDTAGWTDALLRIAAEPALRADLARAGRDRAARFTWEASAARYAAWYDDLAAQLL